MKRHITAAVLAVACVSSIGATTMRRWGYRGHELTGHAAAANLPKDMPEFFRHASAQLEYLNPEPDRWRAPDSIAREMNQAFQYDHFLNFEDVPAGALDAKDRWEYYKRVQAGGVQKVTDVGFLPYRIMELYERLEHEFQLWRNEKDEDRRDFIEARIINDAGILGHYVADGANPHHMTIHYNGWLAGYPNPNNYTSTKGFHSRFEAAFIETHITNDDVTPLVKQQPDRIADVHAGVMQYLTATRSHLDELYMLDKAEPFGRDTKAADHKKFAVDRLVAGADMLRAMWWTAWVKSGEPGAH
jgi:hypothetical protein